jgi:hypothetical protein
MTAYRLQIAGTALGVFGLCWLPYTAISTEQGDAAYAAALRSVDAGQPGPAPRPKPRELLLFDFEEQADLQAWSNLELPDPKLKEPPVKIELSAANATRGRQAMKLTFTGGRWPTVTTTRVPADWMPYWTFKADVTAGRHCVVGFTVLQEKSQRGGGWDPTVSRWTKTEFLKPGKNTVVGIVHDSNNYSINEKNGKVVRFEIFQYNPRPGETLYVDNICLSTGKEEQPKSAARFSVLGTGLEVSGVRELGQKLKKHWTRPKDMTLEQVEGNFKSLYQDLRKEHPGAVLAVFRDGDKGYDPANPDKTYAGWKDAYWSSHGPDGMTIERSTNMGRESGFEIFMRHRSPLMQVDLSSIPAGADILAARLIIIRDHDRPVKEHNPEQPNMWVAEPCNRPWQEYEVNAYEYARDRFWKAIGGMDYGDDPDFLPLYLAHGPSQGKVNSWDFTAAVRFWTDGKHENHGFMLHGDAGDWFPRAHSREAREIKDRPAVWVVYQPRK